MNIELFKINRILEPVPAYINKLICFTQIPLDKFYIEFSSEYKIEL